MFAFIEWLPKGLLLVEGTSVKIVIMMPDGNFKNY